MGRSSARSRSPRQSNEASAPETTRFPVLLADADAEFREGLGAALGRLGCRLVVTDDPESLLSALEAEDPAVLILGADMPGNNILAVVAELRASERWRDLPVFVVSARLDTDFALRAYAEGADAALSKSEGLRELAARALGCVRRASENRVPAGPPPEDPSSGTAEVTADPTDTSGEARTAVPDVVVVEDDPALLEMLTYSLSGQGYELVTYSNGREALDALLAMSTDGKRPVVLLDVDLPGLDGFRILQELTSQRPGHFQVIIATVHSSEAAQVLAIESGALDYIVKPVSMPITLAKVSRLVGPFEGR